MNAMWVNEEARKCHKLYRKIIGVGAACGANAENVFFAEDVVNQLIFVSCCM